jgi:anti-sigma factor RsiW
MVSENRHPDETELLDLVEGDLEGDRRAAVAAHVETCRACSRAVREMQAGRAAARTATRLELDPQARDRITEAIGRERPPARPPLRERLRPALVVLAAVLFVAALAGVVVVGANRSGGGDGQGAGEAAEVADSAAQREESAGSAEAETSPATGFAGEEAASVQGPPAEVARLLREDGFEARVSGRRVVVRGASPTAVAESLARRTRGDVRVIVRP